MTVVVVAGLGAVFSPALAMTHFQISSGDSEPVPERSFEFKGSSYQLDTVILAHSGDTINVSVTAPEMPYRVHIYNSEEQIVDSQRATGDENFTFELREYEPGSYSVTVYQDGDYEGIEPLVVQGYNVSIDAAEQVAADENASLRIDVDRTGADSSPHMVRAVLSDGETETIVNATGADGEYTATIEAGTLSSGNYTVYGLVQGEEEAFGLHEIQGMSERVSLSVEEPAPTPTPTPTAEPSGTTEPASESTPTPTPTATPSDSTATATATPASTSTPTDTVEPESPAITPNEAQEQATTADSGPGFAGLVTVVGIVLGVGLVARRGWE